MAAQLKVLAPVQFVKRFAEDGLRADGRKLDERRQFSVVRNKSALLVSSGGVVAMVTATRTVEKLRLIHYNDSISEFLSLKVVSSGFGVRDLERLECFLLDSLNGCVDLGQLRGSTEQLRLEVTLTVLSADGLLFDCSLAAVVLALYNIKLPVLVDVEDGQRYSEDVTEFLELRYLPIATTYCLVNSNLLLDPSQLEDSVSEGHVVVVTTDTDSISSCRAVGVPQSRDLLTIVLTGSLAKSVPLRLQMRSQVVQLRQADVS